MNQSSHMDTMNYFYKVNQSSSKKINKIPTVEALMA